MQLKSASLSAALTIACLTCSWTEMAVAQESLSATDARNRMVDKEIVPAGIKNPRVIESLRTTPRHEFCLAAERKHAYYDMALPIGGSQTISPPFIVAYMTEQIDPQPTDKVLEIGTGSGYQAAVLSPLVKEVYSIEIVELLGHRAAATLKRLKYANVVTKVGDGYQGWPEHAPFDKIIVTCSPENVPQALVDQLKEGGRMVIPLGERYQQTMYLYKKENGKLVSEALRPTLFVPMTGAAEDRRAKRPDPLHPTANNGSFEVYVEGAEGPTGWHYVRQAKVTVDAKSPDGKQYLNFSNSEPGRGSQALQGFAVDGRKVSELNVSMWVRMQDVKPGQTTDQLPMLGITLYDERRAIIGQRGLGPWRGTFDWREEHERLKIPPQTREAILRIGLLGATGEAAFDGIKISAGEGK